MQGLEEALAARERTIDQLRASAAQVEGEHSMHVSQLLAELADKSSQLVDAERRFSELEALMQRIAMRSGAGHSRAASAAGSDLRNGAYKFGSPPNGVLGTGQRQGVVNGAYSTCTARP